MSDPSEPNPRQSFPDGELGRTDDDAMRELLRGALGTADSAPDLTLGVQRRIRLQSGGKFYADGWSTAKHPPRSTYLITSLMMLFALFVIYALLAPLSGAPEPARPPKPVQIVPARQ